MKINKASKNRSKKMATVVLVAVLLVAGLTFLAYAKSFGPFSKNNDSTINEGNSENSGPTKSEQKALEESQAKDKTDFLDKESKAESGDDTKSSSNNLNTAPENSDIELTASTGSDILVLKTKLKNVSSGSCTVTLTKDAKVVTKSADIIFAPRYSSCAGFSIPKNELGSGIWTISLSVDSDNGTANKSIKYTL